MGPAEAQHGGAQVAAGGQRRREGGAARVEHGADGSHAGAQLLQVEAGGHVGRPWGGEVAVVEVA